MSTLSDVEDLTIRHSDSLREALECIDQTARGICFVVEADEQIAGIATDGDIRRGLLEGADLSDDIRSVMETDVVSLPATADEKEIQSHLSSKIRHIPLLDEDGRLVDYACRSEYRSIPMSSEREITSKIPNNRPGARGECPIALITGITGQDGSYLAELLLEKGYEVHGVKRRASQFNMDRIDHLYEDPHEENVRLFLHYGDLTDTSNLTRIIQGIEPDEIYNIAAQSHVQVSFDSPEYTTDVDALGALRLLEAIRILDLEDKTRFYQASTSELFGKVQETPQTEETPFYPRSPYAAAKLYAYWISVNYREAYGIHASNGILFNHESPRRGKTFVTRKITQAAARISLGLQEKVYLGNLDAKRDWGHARDYVEGMWRMLQQEEPGDYVLATGRTTTVREFCTLAFDMAGIEVVWEGKNENERGYDADTGTCVVEIDPRYYRPTEVDYLLGDAEKARRELGWSPTTPLETMIEEMVEHDLEEAKSKLSGNNHPVQVLG